MANVVFIKETHKYYLNEKELIPVTMLMSKHGLEPSYDGVPEHILKACAKRGTLIHEEIENYFKNSEIGFTREFTNFVNYIRKNKITVIKNEELVNNDMVAGQIDLVLGDNTIADIKTTSQLHIDAISWQLSIYAYLWNLEHDYKLIKGKVFHFDADGKLTVKEIPLKPLYLVEKLLLCEKEGKLFTYDLDFSESKLNRIYEIENYIKTTKLAQKKAELEAEMLKAELLVAMQNQNIKSFKTDTINITVVDEYTTQRFDSKSFKIAYPSLYEKYAKTVICEPYIKITLKEKGEKKND